MSDLTRLMRPILDQLAKVRGRVDHMPTVRWGTVTSADPLLVLLDGSLDADPLSPQTAVSGLAVGDRVVCVEQHRRVIVIGRAGGFPVPPTFAIGEYRHGLWTAETVPAGTLPADGSVHNIADWPLLAAHFETVFGSSNHFGGDGITTFGMPDSRERVAVNQGEAGIFSVLGDAVGAKTHTHDLSDSGFAKVTIRDGNIRIARITVPSYERNILGTATPSAATGNETQATALGGATDAGSSVQPSFVVRVAIQAA